MGERVGDAVMLWLHVDVQASIFHKFDKPCRRVSIGQEVCVCVGALSVFWSVGCVLSCRRHTQCDRDGRAEARRRSVLGLTSWETGHDSIFGSCEFLL